MSDVTFPCGVQGQKWYLIALIPDLCLLTNFYSIISSGGPFLQWNRATCAIFERGQYGEHLCESILNLRVIQ